MLADVKTFSALGAYGCAVITALTAQNTQGVTGIYPVPPQFVAQQIDTLFDDVRIDALKIGMLGQKEVTRAVAQRLAHFKPAHIVLDPVMIAKSGDHLLEPDAITELRESLLPLATVITPNLPEAGVLLDLPPAQTLEEMRETARQLRQILPHDGERWVFLKGGHLPGNNTVDVLYNGTEMVELPGTRIATRNTHGTGCTLSAALAALLPRHSRFIDAAQQAKNYLVTAIARADELNVGSGHGPVHHFYQQW